MTAIFDPDHEVAVALRAALEMPDPAVPVTTPEALAAFLQNHPETSAIVFGPSVRSSAALSLATSVRADRPDLGMVLVRHGLDDTLRGRAVRSGMSEVIELGDTPGLNRAVQECLDEPSGLGRVVTVFSTKGGSGRTTLATNLAAVLAGAGARAVALVDLDFVYGDVATALHISPRATLADAAEHRGRLHPEDLSGLLTPYSPGLDVLVAPIAPAAARRVSPMLVAEVLHVLRRQMDYVVVDTPAGFDDQVLAALDLSHRVALITTLDLPALRNLNSTLQTLRLLGYPEDRWRVVVNRADSQVGLPLQDVQAMLDAPIAAYIPSSGDVPASVNRGAPITVADPTHPVSRAVRELAARHLEAYWLTQPAETTEHGPDDESVPRAGPRLGWRLGRRR